LSYLIILFVVALALAPLSHFVPSKAQRRTSRLREYAALKGLFVEFRNPPVMQRAGLEPRHGQIIYYGKRVRSAGRGPHTRVSWVAGAGGWSGQIHSAAVPSELLDLPQGIIGASADPESCGIYWSETGDEAEIDKICEVLMSLANSLYS